MGFPGAFPGAWPSVRAGLYAVHHARGSGLGEPTEDSLAAVAAEPAFAGVSVGDDPVERGRFIVDRVVDAVLTLRDATPPTAAGGRAGARQRAVVLWSLYLVDRVPFARLADASEDLFDEPLQARYRDQQVTALMWRGGARPSRSAEPGIAALCAAVEERVFAGSVAAEAAATPVPPEQAQVVGQLLALLDVQANEPFPLEYVTTGRMCLPSPLRSVAAERGNVLDTVRVARRHGLLTVAGDTVRLLPAGRAAVTTPLTALTAALFWRDALPANTHHYTSWQAWRPALAHVAPVAQRAAAAGGQAAEDAAYLLDRASVYLRQGCNDEEAARTLAEQAVAVSEQAGRPDPVQHGIYLGNLAIALQHLHRYAEAVATMQQALDVKADASGTDDDEYAGSLNIFANILKGWKRYDEAEARHAEALATMRRVARRDGMDVAAPTLRDTLNDYAADLLHRPATAGPQARQRAVRAEELLREALAITPPGTYGFEPMMLNLAVARRRQADLAGAAQILREQVAHCESRVGDPSMALFGVLAELAEVLDELGDPEAAAVLERAHDVDDAL